MKFIKWKIMLITDFVCALPMLPGVFLWNRLPDTMAIHFNMNNEADGFGSKAFVIFGMPTLMVLLQTICCLINDFNAKKHGNRIKFEHATKWIIPVLSVVLQSVTLAYGLGIYFDIRRIVMVILGVVFLVIGNYLPKFDYIKNYDIETQKARKINRFLGFETVAMGILAFITVFLPPIVSLVWIILLLPYAVTGIVYGIKVGRR